MKKQSNLSNFFKKPDANSNEDDKKSSTPAKEKITPKKRTLNEIENAPTEKKITGSASKKHLKSEKKSAAKKETLDSVL